MRVLLAWSVLASFLPFFLGESTEYVYVSVNI